MVTRLFSNAFREFQSKISTLRRDPLILLNRKTIAIASLGCCTIYALNLETVPYTNRRRFMYIPSRLERMYGDSVIEKWKSGRLKEEILPPSHPDDIRVQKIAKDIIEATRRELRKDRHRRAQTAHVEEFNWEVVVLDAPIDYACCVSGGKIIVFTGLLRACESDDEIAAVIGHEIAHIVARHLPEKVFGTLLAHRLPLLLFITPALMSLYRCRRDEREADYIGLFLSASAGYDPRAALQRLKSKAAETTNELDSLEYIYLTHPPYEERVQLLSNPKVMEEALSIYREELCRRI